MELTPSTAKLIHEFGKRHTVAPWFARWGKMRLPSPEMEVPEILRALHKVRGDAQAIRETIKVIDGCFGQRLASQAAHAVEFLELQLTPPSKQSAEEFESDVRRLALVVRDYRDIANASLLGLACAIAISHQSPPIDAGGSVQQRVIAYLHELVNRLQRGCLMDEARVVAFCQSALLPTRASEVQMSRVFVNRCLLRPQLLKRTLELACRSMDQPEMLALLRFLMSIEDEHGEGAAVDLLENLEHSEATAEILRAMAEMQVRSEQPIASIHTKFSKFRFPSGLSPQTLQRWCACSSAVEMLPLINSMSRFCKGGPVPYLSPGAQELLSVGTNTLDKLTAKNSGRESDSDAEFRAVIRNIAGLHAARADVQEQLIGLFRKPESLNSILNGKLRQSLSKRVCGDGTGRARWVAGILIGAIGHFDPLQFSMISTCVNSGYLFDRAGRFCNPKTFRDFQLYIERDIRNLGCFIDPKVLERTPAEGHVHRLVSFVRDFLADPENAHYTNFEVQSTKPFASGSPA